MSKKIHILQIGLDSHLGGIETYLLKLATYLDKDKYKFSFLGFKGGNPCFQKELEELGCQFYFVTHRRDNYFAYVRELDLLMSKNRFDIIHCNFNSLSNFEPVLLGLRNHLSVLVHSHNGANIGTLKTKLLNFLGQNILPQKKITCVAVSDLAGEWMFGKNGSFTVLNNGLDIKKYRYDEHSRTIVRNELHIGDSEMLLHIGAFRIQKNHMQLIDIFKAYHAVHPCSILVLVGDGELKKDVINKVKICGIENSVIFTGNREDIPRVLSAADKFILPSLYEGFPNVLIEAETNGLYSVVADTITKQAQIGNLCRYVSLDAPMNEWIESLEGKHGYTRSECSGMVKKAGLDINGEMKRLYEVYRKCLPKTRKNKESE